MKLDYCDLCGNVMDKIKYTLTTSQISDTDKSKLIEINTKDICPKCKEIVDFIMNNRMLGMNIILKELETIWQCGMKK